MKRPNRKDISKAVMRKEVLGLFLVLFILFGAYSVKLMGAQPYVVSTRSLGTFTGEGELSHTAVLKNNTLYGPSASMEDYPLPLVDELKLRYEYNSQPGLRNGTYTFTVKVTYYVNKGTQEVVLWEETPFSERGNLTDGGFTSEYTLNTTELDNRSATIAKELGLRRLKRRVTVTASVNGVGYVGGRKIVEKFTHQSELIKDTGAGLYYFTNVKKSEKKPLTATTTAKASASVLGIEGDVGTARTATTALALLMLVPLLGYVYTSRPPRDEMSKLRPYIVKGTPRSVDKRVALNSPDDLRKSFELLERPILNYIAGEDEVYVIIDGDTAYEYRKPLPRKGEKAN